MQRCCAAPPSTLIPAFPPGASRVNTSPSRRMQAYIPQGMASLALSLVLVDWFSWGVTVTPPRGCGKREWRGVCSTGGGAGGIARQGRENNVITPDPAPVTGGPSGGRTPIRRPAGTPGHRCTMGGYTGFGLKSAHISPPRLHQNPPTPDRHSGHQPVFGRATLSSLLRPITLYRNTYRVIPSWQLCTLRSACGKPGPEL